MLGIFNAAKGLEQITSIRQVFCSGEALPHEQVKRFFKRIDARLHNLYGPTEAAVDVTYWECVKGAPGNVVPIGRPIGNIQIFILDEELRRVPIGETGELHIGGIGLARGYWNRSELTAQKFIRNPFCADPGARLYKTGDLARFLPDGNIEYLGRIDFQVKIRGLRIELGEIEAVLLKHPAIQEAAVIDSEGKLAEKRLIAYLVTQPARRATTNELRAFLLQELPDYMVPAAFVVVDTLPKTPGGKVDRRALPAPGRARPALDQPLVAPRTPVEATVGAIWQEVLGLDEIGVHDNFFDLGGHSLAASQVLVRVTETFHVDLPLRVLFEAPTVNGLALAVVQGLMQDVASDERARLLSTPPAMTAGTRDPGAVADGHREALGTDGAPCLPRETSTETEDTHG